ncbi:bestrophin-like domain [Streptomyces venezuelae]|uniref:bestrophin-like domain n=1 Tax=Streptomyces venezuelae TaxID=54571 RepID=UPI003446DF6E
MIESFAIVLGVALLAAAAVLIKHRFWPPGPDDEPREDVAEYISMMVGVLYALVLGLALVSVWDAHSGAEDHTAAEASAAHQIHLLASGLPARQGDRMRGEIESYVRHVADTEWPAMAERAPLGTTGWQLLDKVRATSQVPADATPAQQATGQETLAQLSILDEARRGREADSAEQLSPVIWFGLIVGGVLTIAFMFMFGVRRSFTHVVMVMGLSGLITFTVLLIYQMDSPFAGLFAVDATPFTRYF